MSKHIVDTSPPVCDPYAVDVDDPILIELNRIVDSRPATGAGDACFAALWFRDPGLDVDGSDD